MHTGMLKGSSEQEDKTVAARIEELEGQFRSLHEQLTSELKDHSVQVDELMQTLVLLPLKLKSEYEHSILSKLPTLRTETTVSGVMVHLNPLMNFIDYGLLGYLIGVFGSDRLKIGMLSYESDIQIFMKQTTCAQLIDYFPSQEEISPKFSRFVAKLDKDPHNYTLKELDEVRRMYCPALRLSEIMFHLVAFANMH